MNTVDSYRDPSLDNTVLANARPRQNDDTPEGNGEQDFTSISDGLHLNGAEHSQPDPSVPRGPLISYRGVGPSADPRMHRSFSQRAKGRLFAEEAFSDESAEDDEENEDAVVQPSPAKPVMRSPPQPKTALVNDRAISQDRNSSKQASNSLNLTPQVSRDGRSKPKDEPLSNTAPVSRSVPSQDAVNQTDNQLQNWAPDRSPLQKLEVKLTDISKEEKRARVQKAEMRLREAQASLKARTLQVENKNTRSLAGDYAPQPQPQPQPQRPVVQSGASPRSVSLNAGPRLVAIAGGPQRSRVPVSSQSRASQDDVPRRSASAGQSTGIPLPGQRANVPAVAGPQMSTDRGDVRSSSLRQANSNSIAMDQKLDQVQRAVSLQQRRPQDSARATGRPVTEWERDVSHQAASQQPIGESSPSEKIKGSQGPRKNQQQPERFARRERASIGYAQPVMADIGTLAGEDLVFNDSSPDTSTRSKAQPSFGVQAGEISGVQDKTAGQTVPLSTSNAIDVVKSRQHRSSVSFKEPFDRRRPVDEWRSAETARLAAEDFSTEAIAVPDVYKPWWEQDQTRKGSRSRAASTHGAPASRAARIDDQTAAFDPPLYLRCGPLLRYSGLKRAKAEAGSASPTKEFWRGTVMIVTQDSQCSYDSVPMLRIFSRPKKLLPPPPALVAGGQLAPEYVDPIAGLTKLSRTGRAIYVRPVDHLDEAKDLSRLETDDGIYEASPSPIDVQGSKTTTGAATNKRTIDSDGELLGRYKEVKGVRIYADPDRDVTFWRFNIEIELGSKQQHVAYRINKSAAVGFWVPARGQTMNMMFHTCNGFSIAVDTHAFSGPDPLWRDVLNNHQHRPFHVMIGGGDQVYNDRVMIDTQYFSEWTKIKNPHQKHHAPFTPEMKEELETFYLERYLMWFSQGLFGMANSSIPMINIWDDHDIIDGFGSYPDAFMRSPVFCGLGDIAYKYYLLFQHQTIEAMTEKEEPSWILGHSKGPYINNFSRSLYMELGQHVGFLGVDCRTERTRDDVFSIDTLDIILDRCRREIVEGQTKHLIVLLGVPIAYPRLVWLENMLTSKVLDPVMALGRAGIIKTKLLNRFDGGVEILDDLNDHWTASHHKDERNIFIQDLQDLAAEKSVRITILSGDVHLAAIGQFYSNPKLKIPKDRDHRYMPNIISSAIVNTPPPDLLADVLNKRNKVHHLNKYTDENMIPMFSHDVNDSKRNNNHLLPRRNWCSIREYLPGDTPPPSPSLSATDTEGTSVHSEDEEVPDQRPQGLVRRLSLTKKDFNPRTLMRRLSSRGEPPSSYKDSTDQFDRRRASFDSAEPVQSKASPIVTMPRYRTPSADHVPNVPALRPSFHRRPTNLSEMAVKKGNVLAMDAEGNEFDVNDHIDLEGGLDIVLNCEIDQKDPAGITTPYRLLVPALWYDGSSDREKLVAAPPLNRTGSLLNKLGFSTRRSTQVVSAEEANAQSQSDTESDEVVPSERPGIPKRRFSLFGSKRKKQSNERDYGDEPEPLQPRDESAIQSVQSIQQPTTQPLTQHRSAGPPYQKDRSRGSNVQELSQNDMTYTELPADSPAESRSLKQPRPAAHGHAPSLSSQRSSQRSFRPMSYTIGGSSERPPVRSEYSSTGREGRPPYDPDAAYVSRQHQATQPGPQRSSRSDQMDQSHTDGMKSVPDHLEQPQQRLLRGNGIIGKNVPPSSFRSSHENNSSRDNERGYSGIEAYKDPKPKRRWSLREKARNMIGRRPNEDWYSDEEEEQYWEGPRRT